MASAICSSAKSATPPTSVRLLVVSRGLGSIVLPFRWGAEPEAVLLEITAAFRLRSGELKVHDVIRSQNHGRDAAGPFSDFGRFIGGPIRADRRFTDLN